MNVIGEIASVQPARLYKATHADNNYVTFPNDIGSLKGHTVRFRTIYDSTVSTYGLFGATDSIGRRFDIYCYSGGFRVFNPKNATYSEYRKFGDSFANGDLLDVEVTWSDLDAVAPTVIVNGTTLTSGSAGNVGLSATVSTFYLYSIAVGGGIGNSTYAGNNYLGDVRVYNSSDELLHSWHLDEEEGTVVYDSIQEWESAELNIGNEFIPWGASGWTTHTNVAGGVELQSNTSAGSYTGVDLDMTCGEADNKTFRVQAIVEVTSIDTGNINIKLGSAGGGYTESSDQYRISTTGTFYIDELMVKDSYIEEHSTIPFEFSTSTDSGTTATYTISDISVKEVHAPSHGTIYNATENTFFTEDPQFKSYQNDFGYTNVINNKSATRYWDTGVTVGSSADINLENLKVEALLNVQTATANQYAFRVTNSGTDGRFYVRSNGTGGFQFGNAEIYPVSTGLFEVGEWIKVTAVSLDGIYINDVKKIDTSEGTIGTQAVNTPLLIGNTSNSLLQGIKYFKIYDGDTLIKIITVNDDGEFEDQDGNVLTASGTGDYSSMKIPVVIDKMGMAQSNDVAGGSLDSTYSGITKNEIQLAESNVAQFDGTDDWVKIPGSGTPFAGKAFTRFETKIYPTSTATYLSLFDTGMGYQIKGWRSFLNSSNQVATQLHRSSAVESITSTLSVNLNEWNTVQVEIDEVNKKMIYTINGTSEEISYVNDFVNESHSGYAWVGFSGGISYYGGLIDWLEFDTEDKTYRYDFGEGNGVIVYDRVPTAYGDNSIVSNLENSTLAPYTTFTSNGSTGFEAVSDGSGSQYCGTADEISIITGESYLVEFDLTLNSGTVPSIRFLSGDAAGTSSNIINSVEGHNQVVLTTTNTTTARMQFNNLSAVVDFEVSNLTIKEIYYPINGTITNADINTFWVTDNTTSADNLVNGFSEANMLNGVDDKTLITDSTNLGGTRAVITCRTDSSTRQAVFSGAFDSSIIYFDSSGLFGSGTAGTSGVSTINAWNDGEWHTFDITKNGTNDYTILVDGEDDSGGASTGYRITNAVGIAHSSPLLPFDGEIKEIAIYDNSDVVLAHYIAVSEGRFQDTVSGNYYSSDGSGYKQINIPSQIGNTGVDVNGDFLTNVPKDLTHSVLAYKTVGSFDGVDDYIALGDIVPIYDSSFTVSMWIYHSAIGDRAILFGDYSVPGSNNSMNLEIHTANQLRFWWGGSPQVYGANNTIPLNEWTHVTFVRDRENSKVYSYVNGVKDIDYTGAIIDRTPTSVSYIGRDGRTGATAFEGKISDFRVYDRALSDAEILKLYQKENVDLGLVAYYPFTEGAGINVYDVKGDDIATIKETTASDFWEIDSTLPFSQLEKNGFSQALVNTTDGTAYTPSNVAYGEWEFDLYKDVGSNVNFVPFINSDSGTGALMDGYGIFFYPTTNTIDFRRYDDGVSSPLMATASGYVDNNTWYRLKITRSLSGEFTIYIKGGSFGWTDWTEVVESTGLNPRTDNTYTTSNYFVIDLDEGDEIANVTIGNHRATLHEFEMGTGEYEKKFLPAKNGSGTDVLGSILRLFGNDTSRAYTTSDLAIIVAKRLAKAGVNYWNSTTQEFLTGRAEGTLVDVTLNTDKMKTTSELATISSTNSAEEGHHYWDTLLRKFLIGLANGTLTDF